RAETDPNLLGELLSALGVLNGKVVCGIDINQQQANLLDIMLGRQDGLSKAEFEKSIPRQISDGLVHWSNLVRNITLPFLFALPIYLFLPLLRVSSRL